MASRRTAKKWGDTLADLEAGKRNPRALVVETIGHLKRSTGWLGGRWAISMQTSDVVTDETGRRNHTWRTRRPDEMPENDPAEWSKLIEQADAIAFSARQLADFAHRQRAAAEQRLIDGKS